MDMGSGSCKFLTLLIALLVLSSTAASAIRGGAPVKDSHYIVKTIKGNNDGVDVVDCIQMHKQPAFSHPLLVNHTLQRKPSKETNMMGSKNGKVWVVQPWHKNGRCPHGSIPMQRHHNSIPHFKTKHSSPDTQQSANDHKYAVIQAKTSPGSIHGIHARLNVWNPAVGSNYFFSLTQVWLLAGSGPNTNSMEVGWHVFPGIYNRGTETRLFIYWTKDGYQSTGCYNLCPGFMQTNSDVMIGGAIDPVSTYGSQDQQVELEVAILKDTTSNNWWLYVGGNPIGYWPQNLFTTLANSGDVVQWGGEVAPNSNSGQGNNNNNDNVDDGDYTPTQMGSGHFPDEGYGKASYIRDIYYINTSRSWVYPSSPQDFDPDGVDRPCYNLSKEMMKDELYLFYGGPGCQ